MKILDWVIDQAKLLKPQSIRVITGSEEENNDLIEILVSQGALTKLNEEIQIRKHVIEVVEIKINKRKIKTENTHNL